MPRMTDSMLRIFRMRKLVSELSNLIELELDNAEIDSKMYHAVLDAESNLNCFCVELDAMQREAN